MKPVEGVVEAEASPERLVDQEAVFVGVIDLDSVGDAPALPEKDEAALALVEPVARVLMEADCDKVTDRLANAEPEAAFVPVRVTVGAVVPLCVALTLPALLGVGVGEFEPVVVRVAAADGEEDVVADGEDVVDAVAVVVTLLDAVAVGLADAVALAVATEDGDGRQKISTRSVRGSLMSVSSVAAFEAATTNVRAMMPLVPSGTLTSAASGLSATSKPVSSSIEKTSDTFASVMKYAYVRPGGS